MATRCSDAEVGAALVSEVLAVLATRCSDAEVGAALVSEVLAVMATRCSDAGVGRANRVDDMDERLPYRLLTGPDDADFCRRVSAALAEGYRLHGDPAIAFDGEQVIVAQALVLASGFDSRAVPV